MAVAALLSIQLALASAAAQAQVQAGGPSLIRDAEIEHTIRNMAAPLFSAAGFDEGEVAIHIVNASVLNAFVARGQRIYVTTGLLKRAETPEQIKGVLAHEIGHITGGHLARLEGAISDAQDQAMIASIIGIALGVLAGQPDAGAAAGAKGQDIALRNLLRHTRMQERSADQVAVNLLDETQTSSKGLLQFFEILEDQELLSRTRQDPYLITHPLTRDRIEFVRNHVNTTRIRPQPLSSEMEMAHARMVAKLDGFINPPPQTLSDYKADDPSVPARYARAIALYRAARIDEALPVIDGLIGEAPRDPYFHELRGQMLFENGRLPEALKSYNEAVRLAPDEPLLRVGLAHVQIELNRPELIRDAMTNLDQAVRKDRFNPLAWRLLAIAYGRDGQLGLSALSLAEYNLLTGQYHDAAGQANKALRLLDEGSPAWLRAQDLAATADRFHRRQNR